ncbi:MAG: sialate O-acetylesterase [Bacteroidales bacterium]
MKALFKFVVLCCCLFVFGINVNAGDVSVAPVFQSHMVLQQNAPIRIWGTADINSEIEVELDGNIKTITANTDGEWEVVFPKKKASFTPIKLRVNQKKFTDILIGELWLCSGQSNMAWTVQKSDYNEHIENCDNPNLRLLRMGSIRAQAKDGYTQEELARCNTQDFFKGIWQVSKPNTVKGFSAVAWNMGNKLSQDLNVPVGIILVAVGGSAINNWIPPATLKKCPLTADLYKTDWLSNEYVFKNHKKRAKLAFQNVLNEGEPYIPGEMPYRWMCEPGFLFEAGIQPLGKLEFRGVAWYQGESDAYNDTVALNYEKLFKLMINSWRELFDNVKLPFIYVQLPGYNSKPWTVMREVQRRASFDIPNTSMIVTIDLGLKDNIHPHDKTVVGERLAHTALREIYKEKELQEFPSIKKISLKNNSMSVRFSGCKDGWQTVKDNIPGFEIKSVNGDYTPVNASISDDNIIVLKYNDIVPAGIRYGWTPFPEPPLKLFNKSGLPLGPFTVDIKANSDL